MSAKTRSEIRAAFDDLDQVTNLPAGTKTQVAAFIAVCTSNGAVQR
jgi:hypothetical protein